MTVLNDRLNPTFILDPLGWISKNVFGNDPAPHQTTPATTGSGQTFEPVKTTTVIGYVILAGATIYLARKVFAK